MVSYTAALLLCLAALAATQVQSQDTRSWLANGRGYNVVPQNVSTTLISSVTFTTNNETMTLQGTANFTNAANLTTASLRYASVNETGPVIFTIYNKTTDEAPQETPAGESFSIDFTLSADDLMPSGNVTDFETFLDYLGNGMIYFNVETTEYPEGENRGQLRLMADGETGEEQPTEEQPTEEEPTEEEPTEEVPTETTKKMMRKLLAAK